jgi:N-acyl-D-aspartate/D-glutamate deacylase
MPAFDLMIRGGTIVDETGAPAFTCDVAIREFLDASDRERLAWTAA